MNGNYGCYQIEGGIAGLRARHPCTLNSDNQDAMIPFSSDIKFNLLIRDMNVDNTQPSSADDNMFVFLKGAPERVINRCSTMLINGNGDDMPIDDAVLRDINAANKRFGGNGERVLAFARVKLDPTMYFKKQGE